MICNKNNSYYLLKPHQFLSNQFLVLSFIYSISFNTHNNAMEKNHSLLQLGNRPSESHNLVM